jgi:hypothetical protein
MSPRPVFALCLVALSAVSCKNASREREKKARQEYQQQVDRLAETLRPVLAAVPKAPPAQQPCPKDLALPTEPPWAGWMGMVGRDVLEKIVDGARRIRGTATFIASNEFQLIQEIGEKQPPHYGPGGAVRAIAARRYLAVYFTDTYVKGKVQGRTITKQGRWEGHVVVMDQQTRKVVASLPVAADSPTMLHAMHRPGEKVDLNEVYESRLESAIADATNAGFKIHCPRFRVTQAVEHIQYDAPRDDSKGK